jgi:hypothetical protein
LKLYWLRGSMSCCGRKRDQLRSDTVERALFAPPGADGGGRVFFQYLGRLSARVVGAATGRTYVFGWPGATASVDPRDAPSVAVVPLLRRVSIQ